MMEIDLIDFVGASKLVLIDLISFVLAAKSPDFAFLK